MINLSCLIIDDEPLSRGRIKNLLENFPEISCVGECEDGKSALPLIKHRKPDLIFLDIELKDMTGFDVLNKCQQIPKPKIIFVTAYEEHALKAFDFFASDYLLKPFKEKRFKEAVQKVIQEIKDENIIKFLRIKQIETSRKKIERKLPIKISNKTVFLDLANILYILASGYYVEIYTPDDKYIIRESLNHLNEKLGEDFFRIHRSSIINISLILELSHSDYGELDVRMIDKKLLRVSKSSKKDFLERIGVT